MGEPPLRFVRDSQAGIFGGALITTDTPTSFLPGVALPAGSIHSRTFQVQKLTEVEEDLPSGCMGCPRMISGSMAVISPIATNRRRVVAPSCRDTRSMQRKLVARNLYDSGNRVGVRSVALIFGLDAFVLRHKRAYLDLRPNSLSCST